MATRTKVKLTEFETGDERTVYLTKGHLLFVNYALAPTADAFTKSLVMAYIAAHPSAKALKGPALVKAASDFFEKWDYEEIAEDEEAEEAQSPLA